MRMEVQTTLIPAAVPVTVKTPLTVPVPLTVP
jgi:hypothetical protein